jgi:hypothetical protein
MSDMPERIWAQPDRGSDFYGNWDLSGPGDRAQCREYIRADKVAALMEALKLYSCGEGCNDCPQSERDRVSCGWTARAALAALDAKP